MTTICITVFIFRCIILTIIIQNLMFIKKFLEQKENIKKKSLMAPKLNQMFVKNKNEDDKLISETVGLRTVHEYKKIKDEIYSNKKDTTSNENIKRDIYSKHKHFKLSFFSDDEEEDAALDEDANSKVDGEIDEKTSQGEKLKEQEEEQNNQPTFNELNATYNDEENGKNDCDTNLEKDNTEKNDKAKNETVTYSNKTQTKYEKKNNFKKIMKDPTINTSFLKDKERDEKIELKKKELRELYFKLENEQKEKVIEITYSYYDGSGHRRKISVKQKTTIGQFINKCVDNLKNEFIHLRSASCETLIFVKEDIILPNYLTFYELIKNKAQGKTGPLFSFDAVENLSGITDIRKEKTDTHAGKLVEKKWYEKNKHIFPASKWEIYKPLKTYTTSYTDLFNNFI
ncbi:XAP-5 DNA binding protein, putative [Plasmodium malariae]|uniref:XAP-5 DNA binding protein, putative n=1 Tax=Plasmodium malariae TaxID=5858 RepID=A0A1C3KDA9_PLAMA|nr:XAP-5 DNA binding protein, putative [Plasmodium malariae]